MLCELKNSTENNKHTTVVYFTKMAINPCSRVPFKYQGWMTLLGGFLVHMSLGSYYTFGNLTPYLTSYMRAYDNKNLTYSKTIFVLTIQSLATSVSAVLSGVLIAKFKFKLKTVIVIGLLIMKYELAKPALVSLMISSSLFGFC